MKISEITNFYISDWAVNLLYRYIVYYMKDKQWPLEEKYVLFGYN